MREIQLSIVAAFALMMTGASLAAQTNQPQACGKETASAKKSSIERLFTRSHATTQNIEICANEEIPKLQEITEVANNSTVHVIITKRPIDDCKLKTTSEKYESGSTLNALGQLLAFFSHPGAAPKTFAVSGKVFKPEGLPQPIADKFGTLDDELGQAKIYVDAYQTAEDDVKQFIKCVNSAGCNDGNSSPTKEDAQELLLELNAVLYPAIPPPDTAHMNRIADDIAALLDASPRDSKWLRAAKEHLEEERQSIQVIEVGDDYRRQLRSEFQKLTPDLATYKAIATMDVTLPNQKGTKFTGMIACVNHFTHEQFGSGVPFTVLYYNPAPVTASAGVLISPLGKRPIGVQSQSTPCNSTAASMNCFAFTSTSHAQFVPIGLGNIYLSGSTKINLNFSAGVGVNLNNGSTQVEYFLGPSIGLHGFYISPGLHLARFPYLMGGFQIGDPVPTGGNAATAPVVFRTSAHFAVTISYRLTPAK